MADGAQATDTGETYPQGLQGRSEKLKVLVARARVLVVGRRAVREQVNARQKVRVELNLHGCLLVDRVHDGAAFFSLLLTSREQNALGSGSLPDRMHRGFEPLSQVTAPVALGFPCELAAAGSTCCSFGGDKRMVGPT